MNSKQNLLNKLNEELMDIENSGKIDSESKARMEEIESMISDIESQDSFRSHELSNSIDTSEYEMDDIDYFSDDDDYGYISNSFHNPQDDY